MNWLDAVLIIWLVLAAFTGFYLGVINTIIPLLGLMIGVVAAGEYYTGLANDVFRSHADAAYIGAFVLILVLFLIAAAIVTVILHAILKTAFLDWLNHLLGFAAGALVGILIAGAILSLLLKESVYVSTIADSVVADFVVNKFPYALSLLPGNFDKVKNYF